MMSAEKATDPAWAEARAEAVAAVFKIIAEADWQSPPEERREHRRWIAQWLVDQCGSRTLDAFCDITVEVIERRAAPYEPMDERPFP